MHTFFKQAIASLTILSIFWSDVAFCMQDTLLDGVASVDGLRKGVARAAPVSVVPSDALESAALPGADPFPPPTLAASVDAQRASETQVPPQLGAVSVKEAVLLEGQAPGSPSMSAVVQSRRISAAFDVRMATVRRDGPHSGAGPDGPGSDLRSPLLDGEEDLEEAERRLMVLEERSFLLRSFYWTNLDHGLEKLSYWLFLRGKHVRGQAGDACCDSLWVEGRGVPLKTGFTAARALTGFRQGFEFAIMRPLSLIIQGLIGYQVYLAAQTGNFRVNQIFNIFWNRDETSIKGALAVVVQRPEVAPYYLTFFAFPFIWGFIKAFTYATDAVSHTPRTFQKAVGIVNDFSPPGPRGCCQRFWHDGFRWVLPFHPISRKVNYLTTRLLLDGNLPTPQRQAALGTLIRLAKNTGGWSKIEALDALQKVAAGTSLSQLELVEQVYGKDYRNVLWQEKVRALHVLLQENPGIKKAYKRGVGGLIANFVAHYKRWTLGDFDSKASALALGAAKSAFVGLTINLLTKIADQIIAYLKCPNPLQKGLTSAMKPASYSSLYNSPCLKAYLDNFNRVPGQPASTIVDRLPQFQIDPTQFINLTFSGRGLTGQQIGPIIQALYNRGVPISYLDLSDNNIGGTAADMEALFLPPTLMYLDLSRNNIGTYDEGSEIALGRKLLTTPLLRILKAAGRLFGELGEVVMKGIGFLGDDGTVIIGTNLRSLQELEYLDFSQNSIGSLGANGTNAMGNSFSFLINLKYADLSDVIIKSPRDNGSFPLLNDLKSNRKLQTLILNSFFPPFDFRNAALAALANTLQFLTDFRFFGFSSMAWIDSTTEKGLVELVSSLPFSLQQLDLSECRIGLYSGNVTNALSRLLSRLSYLTDLNLARNFIGLSDLQSAANLFGNISQIPQLTSLYMQQWPVLGQGFIPYSLMGLLRQYWQHRNNQTDVYQLAYVQDVRDYFHDLGNDARSVNLSGNIANGNATMLAALMEELRELPFLEDLDVSNNDIGLSYIDGSSYPQFFADLHFLTTLRSLNLANNVLWIIKGGEVFADLGVSLQNLTRLAYLNIASNRLGLVTRDQRMAVLHALSSLKDLEYLSLSSGIQDQWLAEGTFALSNSVRVLENLRTLLIPGVMPLLNDTTSASLIRFLPYALTTLDVSGNNLGAQGNLTSSALKDALDSMLQLRTLNLADNNITSLFGEGEDVLSAMPSLICNGLQEVDLSGNDFSSDQWGSAAQNLEGLYSSQIQAACEANQCFGIPVTAPTVTNCAANAQKRAGAFFKAMSSAQKSPREAQVPSPQMLRGFDKAPPPPKLLAIAAPPERTSQISSAPTRVRPLGVGIWKAAKSWFSPSAWMDSAYNAASGLIDATCKAAFNLAVERDANTGQLVNTIPVTFPNMLNPKVNDWALPTGEKRKLPLSAAPLVAPLPVLPGPQPLAIAP